MKEKGQNSTRLLKECLKLYFNRSREAWVKLTKIEINPSKVTLKMDIMELNNNSIIICDEMVKVASRT